MSTQETFVRTYLQQHIEPGDWQISHPQQGFTIGQRFVASSRHQKVFVKLGRDARIVELLSNASLTPRYLAGGPWASTWITVQEYVEVSHPDERWYLANKGTLAHLFKRLQGQMTLRNYLPPPANETYRTLFAHYIQEAKDLYQQQTILNRERRREMETLLEQYERHLPFLEGEGLVPVHGDPNPGNLLVTPTNAYLIDWDTLHFSDPLHDIAQILWWQYPQKQWENLLDCFTIDLAHEKTRERFYLSVSIWSLQVSLFFTRMRHEALAQRFLQDARQAFDQQPPDPFIFF